MKIYPTFDAAFKDSVKRLLALGHTLQPNNWQSVDVSQRKEAETHELLNWSIQVPMRGTDLLLYQEDLKPNLPWADDHFLQERVSGHPKNPGTTWKSWPWGLSADKFRTEGQAFSHSYAERYWPRFAGRTPGGILEPKDRVDSIKGVRYPYGDLDDVIARLHQDPLTRQAVLSVWFPEDAHNGGQRVPCSLFYHFIQRGGYLHMVYTIRSCDALRHFRDDIYLSVRLLLWVLEQLRDSSPDVWNSVVPATFTMHITSLHCFTGDLKALGKLT